MMTRFRGVTKRTRLPPIRQQGYARANAPIPIAQLSRSAGGEGNTPVATVQARHPPATAKPIGAIFSIRLRCARKGECWWVPICLAPSSLWFLGDCLRSLKPLISVKPRLIMRIASLRESLSDSLLLSLSLRPADCPIWIFDQAM